MRDLLSDYNRLAAGGRPVGRAVVTSVWGSAPRPEGSSMLATAEGTMAGSVSGGCVEGAAATEIGAAISRGTPNVTFAYRRARGSGAHVRRYDQALRAAAGRPGGARGGAGTWRRSGRDGGRWPGNRRRPQSIRGRTRGGRGGHGAPGAGAGRRARRTPPREEHYGRRRGRDGASLVFLEVFPAGPAVISAVAIAVALVRSPHPGTHDVADGRPAFLTPERSRRPTADLSGPSKPFPRSHRRGLLLLHPVALSQLTTSRRSRPRSAAGALHRSPPRQEPERPSRPGSVARFRRGRRPGPRPDRLTLGGRHRRTLAILARYGGAVRPAGGG